MSFASPLWLLLLSLTLLVVALHLTRRRERPVSSIMHWRQLAGPSSNRPAFRRPPLTLPLVLQVVALSLLVLALAQPVLDRGTAEGPIEHLILVIDASASMRAKDDHPSRFEAALTVARAQISSLAPTARSSIVVASAEPDAVAARQTAARARIMLDGLEALDTQANWSEAAGLVTGLTQGEESTHVVVLTDGPGEPEALAALQPVLEEASRTPSILTRTFGAGGHNHGFAAVELVPIDLEDGDWLLTGQILRSSDEPGEVALEIWFEPRFGGGSLLWRELNLELDSSRFSFEIELQLPEPGALELRLPPDTLSSDNRSFLVVEGRLRAARVLHVGPDNPDLRRALQAVSGVELFESEGLPDKSDEFDLVIIDRTEVSRHPGTDTLWIASSPPVSRTVPSAILADAGPTGWRNEGDLASPIDWSAVEVSTARRINTLPGSTVLLESAEWPLVQTVTGMTGRDTLLAFALGDSNWPALPSFPVFVASLVRTAVPGLGQPVAPWCLTGRECSLPSRPDARLLDPEGRVVVVPYLEQFAIPDRNVRSSFVFKPTFLPGTAGFYRLTFENGEQWIAVNAFHSAETLSVVPASKGEGTTDIARQDVAASIDYFSGWPIWRLMVLLALLLILVDIFAAGLGRENFLRLSNLAIGRPFPTRSRLIVGVQAAAILLLLLAVLDVRLPLPSRIAPSVLIIENDELLFDGGGGRSEVMRLPTFASNDMGLVRLGQRSELLRSWDETSGAHFPASAAPGGDLEGALDLATGMLARAGKSHIVLASSGVETVGELQNSLPRLIENGISVDVLPLPSLPSGEVIVEQVTAPPRLRPSERFEIQSQVFSEREQKATVVVYRNGQELSTRTVELMTGRNRIEAQAAEEVPGDYLFEIAVSTENDVIEENNRAGTYAEVASAPSVLIITPQVEWGEIFANALAIQDLEAKIVEPRSAPWRMKDWLEYEVVVLLNVPAVDLHSSQQNQLERWVSEHGGGLLILGGENSFGPGGYYRTTLEDISPLSSRVPRDAPLVAMLFVLDRSGSMQQTVAGLTRLRIAKEATAKALELLDQRSRLGIVVFDSEASVLVPMQPLGDRHAFAEALEGLGASGGTAIHPALVLAYEEMAPVDAATRHIVLMTDGLSQPGDFAGMMQRFDDEEITVSTVAIGDGADVTLLRNIARAASGTFHHTTDFQALPGILSQEAMLLSGTPLEQTTFVPGWADSRASFMEGLPENLPPLHGYVRTTAKPEAIVHLRAPEEDPLLASWRFGLGRALAFSSHGSGSWSRDWLEMPSYPLLWSQAVRWAQPLLAGPGLDVRTQRHGDEVRVLAEAVTADGDPYTRLQLEVSVTTHDKDDDKARTFNLEEIRPGQYLGKVLLPESGSYELTVAPSGQSKRPELEPASSLVHVSYPARYSFGRQDMDRLLALSQITGGRLLLGGQDVKARYLDWVLRPMPVWRFLLAAALLLFLMSLLYRYASMSLISNLKALVQINQARR